MNECILSLSNKIKIPSLHNNEKKNINVQLSSQTHNDYRIRQITWRVSNSRSRKLCVSEGCIHLKHLEQTQKETIITMN